MSCDGDGADAPLFVSYSQHGEDVVLWRALGDRSEVVYVDVGAFDPTVDSVTRALYERGWRGVNVDADPDLMARFDAARPEDRNVWAAIGVRDGTTTLRPGRFDGWSTILSEASGDVVDDARPEIEVPLRRLSTVLDELAIDHVDVLKIDVEGAEPDVVRGMLDGVVRPVVCVVEGVCPARGRAAGDEAVALLVGAGYLHCMFDGLNHWLTTDAGLVEALSVPANPFDCYVPARRSPDEGRAGSEVLDEPRGLATLLLEDMTAEDKVAVIYGVILGRAPDPGAVHWLAQLERGDDAIELARRVAETDEAHERPEALRQFVVRELDALSRLRAQSGRGDPPLI